MIHQPNGDWKPVEASMLLERVMSVRKGIQSGQFINEASVAQGIVLPLLQALGWPVFNTQVVWPEYSVSGRRVDYALCHPVAKPVIFVEVKQIGQSDGADRQLFEYAFHMGIPMAILTDGQQWNFFLPGGQGDYSERRLYKLDIVERDIVEIERRFLRYLEYRGVCSGAAWKAATEDYENVARARIIRESLPQAWGKLVEEEDDMLLELVAEKVESICGYKPNPDTVASFLKNQGASAVTETSHRDVKGVGQLGRGGASPEVAAVEEVGFDWRGQFRQARSAKDVLVSVFEAFSADDDTFLDRFAGLPKHGRKRRFLAKNRGLLYPDRPDLCRTHAHELKPGWWVATNLSRGQIERIIRMACGVRGIDFSELRVNLGS